MKLTFYCQSCSQKLNVGYSQIGTIVRCPACDMAQPVSIPLARRYQSLRAAAVTLQVVGVVVALALCGLVFMLMARYQLWSAQQFIKGLVVLGLGLSAAFATGILTYAAGEVLRLLVDLENNARSTRLHLEMMRAEQRPPAPVTEVPQQPTP
ncbi:MAG: hypothetical protein N2689_08540 [Verrucomicrobiae bacterium]|nr:hypothetical protein [Verrucomicrobiae bacterium]